MIEDLLKCLNSYKIGMDYKGKDFDGDRVQQYGKKKKKYGQNISSTWDKL